MRYLRSLVEIGLVTMPAHTVWDRESIADHLDELEPVEVRVKSPLVHTLSVRVAREDLRKLRELGKQTGLGTTTMARVLLRQALTQPALRESQARYEASIHSGERRVPVNESDPTIYFFSNERIAKLTRRMEQAAADAFAQALTEISRLTPEDREYKRLKEKDGNG